MDGQLIVTVKILASWALEITIMRYNGNYKQSFENSFSMPSIIGDKRLACSFQYSASFLNWWLKNQGKFYRRNYGKNYDNINKNLPLIPLSTIDKYTRIRNSIFLWSWTPRTTPSSSVTHAPAQRAKLSWINVDSTLDSLVGSTLIFGWQWKMIQRWFSDEDSTLVF